MACTGIFYVSVCTAVQACVSQLCHCFSGSSKALEMVAYDFCKASSEAGVVYAEMRFNPTLLIHSPVAVDKGTLSNDEVMDAILKGLEKGQKEFGLKVNIIIAFLTHMSGKPPYRIQCNSSSNRSPYRIQCNSTSNRSPYRIQ